MRTLLTGSLFALALLVAACGGGGRSGVIPALGGGSSGGNPSSSTNGKAAMVLYIPPPSRQDARKPFYISPGTQSFGVLAVSVTSTATPNVTNEQIFPVATPSPCAAASGGGLSCTFTVTAPIGLDVFYVAAYAAENPGPNAVPISQYVATGVNVSASPSPGATPLSFTLNGVVYQVDVTVPTPGPGSTEAPNTFLFPAGVASQPQPLTIAAYDSSGNQILLDPTTPFAGSITVEVSPAGGGVGLETIGPSQCATAAPASTRRRAQQFPVGAPESVTLDCASDLTNVEFGYDGTTTPDPNDHVVDTFTIASTTQRGNPTPSPANVLLESNVIPYQIPLGGSYPNDAFLTTLSNGQLLYLVNIDSEGDEGLIGTFTPSTATLTAPVTLNGVEYPSEMAVAPNGTFFVVDDDETIDCWSTVTSALSGAAPSASFTPPPDPYEYVPDIYALTVDSANNVWAVGFEYYSETYQDYATYFPAASGCNATPTFGAYIALNGDTDDSSTFITPLNGGGMAYASQDGYGLYTATTANAGGSVNSITPALGSDSEAGGIGTGANGTVYSAFYNYDSPGDIETLPSGGSSLTSLLSLVPTSPVNSYGPAPYGLSVFSLNGVADRISYADDNFYALGIIGNLSTTPTSMLISLPNVYSVYQTTHNDHGGEYIIYEDGNDNMYLTRAIQTTTWNVPNTSIATGACGDVALMSINQRAPSSGPFTLGFPSGGSATPVPGAQNDQALSPPGSGAFPVTVTDAHGRTESYSVTATNNEGC